MVNRKIKEDNSFAIGVIGGGCGPTAVFITGTADKEAVDIQWQRALEACRRQVVPRAVDLTGEEIKTFLVDTYGAFEIDPIPSQRLMLKVNVLSSFYPQALQQPPLPDENANIKEWQRWAQQQHMNYLEAAKQVSDEDYNLRYLFLQIPGDESDDLEEQQSEILLEIELTTGYMSIKNGSDILKNEIILWRGVTMDDVEKCTPRFMAYAAAMRDMGKLDLR